MTSIRRMRIEDLESVLELVGELDAYDGDPPKTERARRALRLLMERPDYGQVYVLEEGGEVGGYAVGTLGFTLEAGGRVLLIDELYLRPEYRGCGVGSALLSELVAFGRAAGCQDVDLEVSWSNATAIAWYERLGFQRHRRHYYTAKTAELIARLGSSGPENTTSRRGG